MPILTEALLDQMAWGVLALGLVLCFFGYRLFLPALAFGGFAVAGLAAGAGGLLVAEDALAAGMAGVVGGVIGGITFVLGYGLLLFAGGAISGLALAGGALWLAGASWGGPAVAVLVAGVLAGGVGAMRFQRLVIIGSSAFKGACFIVIGGAYLLLRDGLGPLLVQAWDAAAASVAREPLAEAMAAGFGMPPVLRAQLASQIGPPQLALFLIGLTGLTALGMAVHYTLTARPPEEARG
jgi:hypothetical protein